jgi:hypothetical protein
MGGLARLLGGLAIAAIATTVAASQTRPDFSGRWTSEPETATQPGGAGRGGQAAGGQRAGGGGAPGAPAPGQRGGGRGARGDMGSGWGTTITITQDARQLVVEYAFYSRGDLQPPLRFVYALDGSETRNTMMMGRGFQEQRSRAAWDGDRLVITTIHALTDPATGRPATAEVKQVLSIDAAGALVVETTRGGALGGAETSTRTAYRKLPAGAGSLLVKM